ncbi:hypothetical protein SCD_n00970 [Sulfuricella denitrificans skB26]|uniref:Uncharacterized protein n=1 Tax=Sulfuricella denitrificans (strain DSM 22764 / NBRC 105220 / skB26) TaxID=1163617 RepID=S6A9W3_SULDS|nr:hypothetical protein SCD_n00970 [Sulfuricella denitrificans skB26]
MPGRLAGGRTAVMTGIACALNNSLSCPVLEIGWCPADVQVTGIAGSGGRNMHRRLSGRPPAGTVAGCTIAGSASEQALGMAGFAGLPGVSAIQKKARRIVVEG